MPQLTDQYGNPLVGSKFYSYAAGTLVFQPVYSDVAGTTPIAQGATVSSSGWFPFFMEPGKNYDFVFKTATGVEIWSVEDVPSIPASASNQDITGIAGETILAGQACYVSDGSGSKTAGSWYLADADLQYASITPTIGFAVSDVAVGNTGVFRLGGTVTLAGPLTIGAAYYISTTAGAVTTTAPTNERRVGQAQTATTLIITANPVQPFVDPSICQGRLTLTSGIPVTTADVTAATSVKWCPYTGNQVALFNGSAWVIRKFTELSIAVPATTAQMYDLFVFDSFGIPTLGLTAWTNDTTRAAALAYQDGVLVKLGDLTRRYLGSFRTTAVSGQTEDSVLKRFLSNVYFPRPRRLLRYETTATWDYTTAVIRQANGAAANKVEAVIGWSEQPIDLTVMVGVQNTTGVTVAAGIGEDSTSTFTAGNLGIAMNTPPTTGLFQLVSRFVKIPTVGYHFYAWNECSGATGTSTWVANGNGTSAILPSSGIEGTVIG